MEKIEQYGAIVTLILEDCECHDEHHLIYCNGSQGK